MIHRRSTRERQGTTAIHDQPINNDHNSRTNTHPLLSFPLSSLSRLPSDPNRNNYTRLSRRLCHYYINYTRLTSLSFSLLRLLRILSFPVLSCFFLSAPLTLTISNTTVESDINLRGIGLRSALLVASNVQQSTTHTYPSPWTPPRRQQHRPPSLP